MGNRGHVTSRDPVRAGITGLGLLFAMSCARAPASAPRAPAVSPASAPLASQDGGAAPPAPVSSDATDESRTVKDWFCYSWVHGRDFASPCLPTAHACAQAIAKDAHRDKKPCSAYSGTVTCVASGAHAAREAPPAHRARSRSKTRRHSGGTRFTDPVWLSLALPRSDAQND